MLSVGARARMLRAEKAPDSMRRFRREAGNCQNFRECKNCWTVPERRSREPRELRVAVGKADIELS